MNPMFFVILEVSFARYLFRTNIRTVSYDMLSLCFFGHHPSSSFTFRLLHDGHLNSKTGGTPSCWTDRYVSKARSRIAQPQRRDIACLSASSPRPYQATYPTGNSPFGCNIFRGVFALFSVWNISYTVAAKYIDILWK